VVKIALAIVAAILAGGVQSVEAQSQSVEVYVSEEVSSGHTTYRYQVINGSPYRVTSLVVGFDGVTRTAHLPLPPTSLNGPAGWEETVVGTEETPLWEVQWANSDSGIPPGGAQGGFEIVVPQPEPNHREGAEEARLPVAPLSVADPPGWRHDVFRTEESAIWEIVWTRVVGVTSGIEPGATFSGFEATVSQPQPSYREGPYTLYLDEGSTLSADMEPDDSPLFVSITSPGAAQTVSGIIDVTAATAGTAEVSSFQFELDGGDLGSPLTAPPYSTPWDTRLSSAGSHVLGAVAVDAEGSMAAAPAVQVTVLNAVTPETYYLHGDEGIANPLILLLDTRAPGGSTVKYKDFMRSIQFSGGNPWKLVGAWMGDLRGTPPGSLIGSGDLRLWLGLKSSGDQGTQFDVKAALSAGGAIAGSGTLLCVTGLTSTAAQAREVAVPIVVPTPVPTGPGKMLGLTISTRIGTNPNGTQCAGRSSASGLRVYFDATTRPASVPVAIQP